MVLRCKGEANDACCWLFPLSTGFKILSGLYFIFGALCIADVFYFWTQFANGTDHDKFVLAIMKPNYICLIVAGALYMLHSIMYLIGSLSYTGEAGRKWLRSAIVLGYAAMLLQLSGEWYTISKLESFSEPVSMQLVLSFILLMIWTTWSFYLWNAAKRFHGTSLFGQHNSITK